MRLLSRLYFDDHKSFSKYQDIVHEKYYMDVNPSQQISCCDKDVELLKMRVSHFSEESAKDLGLFRIHSQELYDGILMISHRWETPDNPDPDSKQFDIVKKYLSDNKSCMFVFYDYSGMPQKPRTPTEDLIFRFALENLNNWYFRYKTLIIDSGDYYERAWCIFESSQLLGGPNEHMIDKNKLKPIIAHWNGTRYKNWCLQILILTLIFTLIPCCLIFCVNKHFRMKMLSVYRHLCGHGHILTVNEFSQLYKVTNGGDIQLIYDLLHSCGKIIISDKAYLNLRLNNNTMTADRILTTYDPFEIRSRNILEVDPSGSNLIVLKEW